MISKAASLSLPASPLARELTGSFATKKLSAKLRRVYSQVDHVFPGHMDPFDGERLRSLATDYISNAGACHRISSTLLRGIATMVLKAKYSGNVAAKCCYHACCCCCCLV